jgi:serine/threonine-protein kinase HipA
MRKANVFVDGVFAGILEELPEHNYHFNYESTYKGLPVSLTMPTVNKEYHFTKFPPFFEGLLPEGPSLEVLLKKYKLDRNDYFGQLIQVGQDLVGAVTVELSQ